VLATLHPASGPTRDPMGAVEALRSGALAALAARTDFRMAAAARAQSAPPTYAVYRAFAEGLDRMYDRRDDAEAAFLRAYALDSSFVLPLLYVGIQYDGAGNSAALDSLVRRLLPRRGELPVYQQRILDLLAATVDGDIARQYDAARQAAEIAPGSLIAAYHLPKAAIGLNRPHEAVRLLDLIDPDRDEARGLAGYWSMLSMALHMDGEYRRQLVIGREAERRIPRDARGLFYQVRALAALGRVADLEAVLAKGFLAPASPGWEAPGLALHVLAFDELSAHGHGREAKRMLEGAVRAYAAAPAALRRVPRQQLEIAVALFRLGRVGEARATFERLTAEGSFRGRDSVVVAGWVGCAAAAEGDTLAAAAVDRWLRNLDTPYLFGVNTRARARIAALGGRRLEAVELLRQAVMEGNAYDNNHHLEFALASLRNFAPFEEWLRPKG
jgi:tetratricopeptide (TPR) repeat protein